MATEGRCRWYKCCFNALSFIFLLIKKSMPIIIIQLIGWAIFSYVEDDLNVIDCFQNPKKVAEEMYPASNEAERATILFYKLYNKTGQALTVNQSIEMYSLFKTYFNVPYQGHEWMPEELKSYLACFKWFRFSILTSTTIGYGVVTPKSSLGKLLTIPYALISIPVVLSHLAFVGSMVSKFIEWIMLRVHKCIKGNKPLRCKALKRCFYLYILLFLISFIMLNTYVHTPNMFESRGAMRWLNGFYFIFVTYTTVGFGDINGPADDHNFYTNWFFIGLAVASGLFDSLVSLINEINFDIHADNAICCCITCNEESTTTTAERENNNHV